MIQETEADETAELPSVKVYYTLNQPRTERKPFMDLSQLPGKVDKADYALTGVSESHRPFSWQTH